MRLRARVKERTGATRHTVGGVDRSSQIASVVIEPNGNEYYLYYFDSADKFITDTWHMSLEGAKGQAAFEFNITDADWEPID